MATVKITTVTNQSKKTQSSKKKQKNKEDTQKNLKTEDPQKKNVSQRPDGSFRPAVAVKPGYVNVEEVPKYKCPQVRERKAKETAEKVQSTPQVEQPKTLTKQERNKIKRQKLKEKKALNAQNSQKPSESKPSNKQDQNVKLTAPTNIKAEKHVVTEAEMKKIRELRYIKKKLRGIRILEEKLEKGETINNEQLLKLKQKDNYVQRLSAAKVMA